MTDIVDVPVGAAWVDINTVTSIAVGTAMQIMNKGSQSLFITESTLEPSADDVGNIITSVGSNYATASITTSADRIWCFCPSPSGTTLAVQEVV